MSGLSTIDWYFAMFPNAEMQLLLYRNRHNTIKTATNATLLFLPGNTVKLAP